MFVHLTTKALDRTLLFHDWDEAIELWRRLVSAFPEARALCLMPNHPHVVTPAEGAVGRMRGVMSGYARWRAHHRGVNGRCWQRLVPPETLPDEKHMRRTIRYVLLNPCRGDLADDPLGWPLSLHRDLVGLGGPGRRVRDPARFHAYVSADPSVSLVGTELPGRGAGVVSLESVSNAVSAILRLQPADVLQQPEARRLCVRAAWLREQTDARALGDWVGARRTRIYEYLSPRPSMANITKEPLLDAVLRVIDDPRFGPLVLSPRADPTRWSGWRMTPSRR